MAYQIILNLPEEWKKKSENYIDETGAEIAHLEASLPGKGGELAYVDIYVGELPEGETAEDQAYANYAETVGFDENDDEDCGIFKFKFNGKNAYGFDAYTENEQPMKFISQEVKKGVLAIIVYCVQKEEQLESVFSLLERSFRVK